MSKKLWNERYKNEGHLWGDDPSLTAQLLMENLEPGARTIEFGIGYGRDIIALSQAGHIAHGIDEAQSGIQETIHQLQALGIGHTDRVIEGNFMHSEIANKNYDAVLSHRTLHLLTSTKLVDDFARKAANVLKPRGLLYVSARDTRDFNTEQMRMIDADTAQYTLPGRKGHLISFWHEARFRGVFNKYFDIKGFVKGTEIESGSNPNKQTCFTIMMAQKMER